MAIRKPKSKAQKTTPSLTRASSGVPSGVKVIAVLQYVGAAFSLLFALLFFVGSAFVDAFLSSAGLPIPAGIGAAVAIVLGVISLAFSVLGFFMGRGLWKGQQWARVLTIIFSVIGFLGGLMGLFQGDMLVGVFYLIIYGIIGGYLWFNQDVKNAFS